MDVHHVDVHQWMCTSGSAPLEVHHWKCTIGSAPVAYRWLSVVTWLSKQISFIKNQILKYFKCLTWIKTQPQNKIQLYLNTKSPFYYQYTISCKDFDEYKKSESSQLIVEMRDSFINDSINNNNNNNHFFISHSIKMLSI